MMYVVVNGEQIKKERFLILERSVIILNNKNPGIDWDSNDLALVVVPRAKKNSKT